MWKMKIIEVITLCVAVCALLVATVTFLNLKAVQQDIKRLDNRISAVNKTPTQTPVIIEQQRREVGKDREIEQIKKIIKDQQQEIKELKAIVKGTKTKTPISPSALKAVRLPLEPKLHMVKIGDIESQRIEIIKRQTLEFLKTEIGLDSSQIEKIKPAVERFAKSLRRYKTILGIKEAQNIRIRLINEIAGYLTQEQLNKLKVVWKIEEE
jgi:sialic acid synthase SpsE